MCCIYKIESCWLKPARPYTNLSRRNDNFVLRTQLPEVYSVWDALRAYLQTCGCNSENSENTFLNQIANKEHDRVLILWTFSSTYWIRVPLCQPIFNCIGKWNKFYFRFFFFAAKKLNWTSIFVLHLRITRKLFSDGKSRGALLARAALKRTIRNWRSFPYSLVITKPFYAL